MAGSTAATPYGAVPIRHLNGSPYNGKTTRYYIPSTDSDAVFVGDFVELAGGLDPTGTCATVKKGAATNQLLGVVVSCDPNRDDLSKTHRVASTNRYVNVADDPDLIFKIQEDGSGGAMTAAEIATCQNGDIVASVAGSAVTGRSGMQITSAVGTGSAQLKVLKIYSDGNSTAATLYQDLEVMIFEHALKTADSQA